MATLSYGGCNVTVAELEAMALDMEQQAERKSGFAASTSNLKLRASYLEQASARSEEAAAIRRFIARNQN